MPKEKPHSMTYNTKSTLISISISLFYANCCRFTTSSALKLRVKKFFAPAVRAIGAAGNQCHYIHHDQSKISTFCARHRRKIPILIFGTLWTREGNNFIKAFKNMFFFCNCSQAKMLVSPATRGGVWIGLEQSSNFCKNSETWISN